MQSQSSQRPSSSYSTPQYQTLVNSNQNTVINGGERSRDGEDPKHGIGLGLRLQPGVGYTVVSVCPSSSADKAGINVNDVLTAADGKTVHQGLKPLDILGPKRSVAVLTFEDGRVIEVVRGGPALDSRGLRQDGLLGLSVSRVQGRVLVAHVASNSPAQREGLQMGDCILTMNGSPCDPSRLTSRGAVGSKVVLTVQRHAHAQPKTVTLTRVAVGTGWKPHASSTPRGDREAEGERDDKSRLKQSRFATFVPRSPSKGDRPRTASERTLPSKTERQSSHTTDSHPLHRSQSSSSHRSIDNMHTSLEELQAEVEKLRGKLAAFETMEEKLQELKKATEELKMMGGGGGGKKSGGGEDDVGVESELEALKAKVEQNTTQIDEATTAIKMMNLGIHAAINGVSHELDMLFEHCKIKRPPRGPPPGEGGAGGPPGRPGGNGALSMPPPASRGKGRKPGTSPLSSLTEGTTLSPQSMRVHSNNPSAPGGLAVLGSLPTRKPTAVPTRSSAHEV